MFSWDQWDAPERFTSRVRWGKVIRVDFEIIQAYFAIRGWTDCGQCFKILEKEMATHSSILAWKIPLSQTYIYLFFDRAARGLLVPQPGIKPKTLHWMGTVLTTGLPGKSLKYFKWRQKYWKYCNKPFLIPSCWQSLRWWATESH